MRCTMRHFLTAIDCRADDAYIADNIVRGSYNALDDTVDPGDRADSHGIHLDSGTAGNVVCYNAISLVADGIHAWGRGRGRLWE